MKRSGDSDKTIMFSNYLLGSSLTPTTAVKIPVTMNVLLMRARRLILSIMNKVIILEIKPTPVTQKVFKYTLLFWSFTKTIGNKKLNPQPPKLIMNQISHNKSVPKM